MRTSPLRRWIARILVTAVFSVNLQSALAFIGRPWDYVSGFELTGPGGQYLIQTVGVLFLMWNVTYPPVIVHPARYRVLFGVVILQQLIGLVGESWLLSSLPSGHLTLATSAARFIYFDTLGLIALLGAFFLTRTGSGN